MNNHEQEQNEKLIRLIESKCLKKGIDVYSTIEYIVDAGIKNFAFSTRTEQAIPLGSSSDSSDSSNNSYNTIDELIDIISEKQEEDNTHNLLLKAVNESDMDAFNSLRDNKGTRNYTYDDDSNAISYEGLILAAEDGDLDKFRFIRDSMRGL